jgi:hypothetical protein
MKTGKILAALAFAVVIGCTAVSAQENKTAGTDFKSGISVSGLWRMDRIRSGGSMEVGFPVYTGNMVMSDYITLNGYGGRTDSGTSFGEMSIGNKFRVGGRYIVKSDGRVLFVIIPYGVVNAEFGFVGADGKNFFHSPFLADIGGGGGFELQFMERQSFFIEYGGGGFFPVGYDSGNYADVLSSGYGAFAVGYRTYF